MPLTTFDADARQRIRRAVRKVEAGDPLRRGARGALAHGPTVWLAEANETIVGPALCEFTLLQPGAGESGPGTAKGSESVGSQTVEAFVRRGVVLEFGHHLLIEACAADDTVLEVLDPALALEATAAGTIAEGADGDVTAGGATIEVRAAYFEVVAGTVFIQWDHANDRFTAIQQTCP